jgi:hypothetical protein
MDNTKDIAKSNLIKIFKGCTDETTLKCLSDLLEEPNLITKSKPDFIIGTEEDV